MRECHFPMTKSFQPGILFCCMIQTKQVGTTWLFRLYAALFVVLPWSMDIAPGSWHIRLPSEALTLFIGLSLLWFVWQQPALLRTIRYRQILIAAVIAWMVWLTFSMSCSTMPLVSFKYWLVDAGQWWVFFAGILLFPGWWRRLLPFFICSMGVVVVYTLAHHYQYDFRADQSMLAPMPFFPDHTLYSAILVMLLPILPFLFKKHRASGFAVLFFTGLLFANCRAAWFSLMAGLFLLIPFVFHNKWKWLVLLACLAIVAGALMQDRIKEKISHDVSSLERFNRYSSALRMANSRPLTGFGPGTFQFRYITFQQADEMTRISITDPEKDIRPDQFGRGGGAHSEYFQALAENGWPGLFFWLVLVCATVYKGVGMYLSGQNNEHRWLVLAVTFSLLTLFLHTLFNNFLHDGRIAMLFWGQVAWLMNRDEE